MFYQFLSSNLPELITRCRKKAAKRSVPFKTLASYIEHGVPLFLPQVIATLRLESTTLADPLAAENMQASADITRVAGVHGAELFRRGYTFDQVVHEYGDVCQAVTELAVERDKAISPVDFHVFNRCLDHAIAGAITTFGHAREVVIHDQAVTLEHRLRTLSDDQRRLVDVTMHSFLAIKTGTVGLSGATGTLLLQALNDLRVLTDRTMPELCLAAAPSSPLPKRQPVPPIL